MSLREQAQSSGISYAAAKQKAYRARRKDNAAKFGNTGNGNKGNGNAASVTSNGDGNALLAQVERLRIENATLRADLFAAHQRLRELTQEAGPVEFEQVTIVPFDDI